MSEIKDVLSFDVLSSVVQDNLDECDETNSVQDLFNLSATDYCTYRDEAIDALKNFHYDDKNDDVSTCDDGLFGAIDYIHKLEMYGTLQADFSNPIDLANSIAYHRLTLILRDLNDNDIKEDTKLTMDVKKQINAQMESYQN